MATYRFLRFTRVAVVTALILSPASAYAQPITGSLEYPYYRWLPARQPTSEQEQFQQCLREQSKSWDSCSETKGHAPSASYKDLSKVLELLQNDTVKGRTSFGNYWRLWGIGTLPHT